MIIVSLQALNMLSNHKVAFPWALFMFIFLTWECLFCSTDQGNRYNNIHTYIVS